MRKGQLSVINLIGLFIVICLFGVLITPLDTFINLGMGKSTTLDSILSLILPVMAIMIVASVVMYGKPYYEG